MGTCLLNISSSFVVSVVVIVSFLYYDHSALLTPFGASKPKDEEFPVVR